MYEALSWCEERQNPWVCKNSQSILCTYETDPRLNCWSTRRCFSSVYRVVYAVSLICYTPDRELYGSVMQAEFLFCLQYVSLSESTGIAFGMEKSGRRRITDPPGYPSSRWERSPTDPYLHIKHTGSYWERENWESIRSPQILRSPTPTKLHYKSTLSFPSVFFTLDHVIRLFSRFMEMARQHVVAGIIENSFLLYLKTFSCKKKRITTMLIVQQWG